MRLAEAVLRAGAGVVALLVGYAHCLLLAVIPRVECKLPDSDPFFASLALGVVLALMIPLASLGLPLRAWLRVLTLPFVLLVPLAALAVLPYLEGSAVATMHHCSATRGLASASEPALWHRGWAPFQLGLLGVFSAQCLRFWRRA